MKDPQSDMYRRMMKIAGVKDGYHRDQVFNEEKRSDYLWCLHCQRTYHRGEYRDIDGIQMCPYNDCDGNTVMDGFDWESVRDLHDSYPVKPERGKVYNN